LLLWLLSVLLRRRLSKLISVLLLLLRMSVLLRRRLSELISVLRLLLRLSVLLRWLSKLLWLRRQLSELLSILLLRGLRRWLVSLRLRRAVGAVAVRLVAEEVFHVLVKVGRLNHRGEHGLDGEDGGHLVVARLRAQQDGLKEE